jgi:hypothetical protein
MEMLRASIASCLTTLAEATLASSAWAGDITVIGVVNSGG